MMDPRPAASRSDRAWAILGGVMLAGLLAIGVGLGALVWTARSGGLAAGGPEADPSGYAYADPLPAPPIELTDQDGRPFSLESIRPRPALVFFGYTHCPDVCPTTVGTITEALVEVGPGPRAVFVSIDPDRDDPAALKSYLRYLNGAFIALTGAPTEVKRAADGWSVNYGKIDTGSAGGYAMAHTADLYLVDGQGRLRARYPFGTPSATIAATLRSLLRETPVPSEPPATPYVAPATPVPPATATPGPSAGPASPGPAPTPTGGTVASSLQVLVVSTSVWSGGGTPVILGVWDEAGTRFDGSVAVRVRATRMDGTGAAAEADAVAVRPIGEPASYVATLDLATPGRWRLDVTATSGATGSTELTAYDPGGTAPLGAPAPDVRTPTLADVGGIALAVTTQPQPDLRFSRTSTVDARAAGMPYVLVVDSARFQVTTACGRALAMVRYLLDRWTSGVAFIHLEPFEYSIITSEPVLSGDIADPPLNRQAKAFGLGPQPWPATQMPWVFVVDGRGIVRAKYAGVVGSPDVDVILTMIVAEEAAGS